MANVEIYHTTDVHEWAVYLEQILQASPYNYTVYIQNVHELLASPPRDDSYVCILIISPSIYAFLSQKHTNNGLDDIWKRIFPRAKASLIMFYGHEEPELVKDGLAVSCPGYKDIKKYQIKAGDDDTSPVFGMIKDLYMDIFSLSLCPEAYVHPPIVSSTGEKVLVVCGQKYKGVISIEIEDYAEIMDVIKLNPYTYTFTMPSIVSYGTKYVTLCQDTHTGYNPVGRGKIEISSTSDVVASILKTCLTQSELLMQTNLAVSKPSCYSSSSDNEVTRHGNAHAESTDTCELYANASSDTPSDVNSKTCYNITSPKASSAVMREKDGVRSDRPHSDDERATNDSKTTEESQMYANFDTIRAASVERVSNIKANKKGGYN